MTKIIAISGEIGWDVWPDGIRREIKDADGDDIDFQISSPGGYIFDGIEIFNLIRMYQGKTTTTAIGMAASMASYLLMAGDVKRAVENAIFMMHNAMAFKYGDQNAHRKVANTLEGMSDLLVKEYIKQTGKTKKDIQALMGEESYFFGDEIFEAGFVDEIIKIEDIPGAKNIFTNDTITKEEAISSASAKVAIVMEKIKSKPEDFSKIAAVLKSTNKPKNIDHQKAPNGAISSAIRQSATNLNKKEEKTMTLDEFLASDVTAKVEYEKRLAEAKDQGIKAKQSEIDRVYPLISAEGISAALRESGLKALKGEQSVDSFVAIAAYEARKKEEDNSAKTATEQKPDTAVDPNATNSSNPKNADDMKSLAKNLKEKVL